MATLVRWEPIRELATLQTEMSRLMNGLFEGNGRTTQSWVPAVDVWETENDLVYAFDLPGVPMRLTVKSNKNPYAEGEDKGGPAPRSSVPNFAPKLGKKVAAPKGVAATRAKIAAGPPSETPEAKAKPKPKVKPKTKLISAGKMKIGPGASPKGRTAKLNRPGVKPKRASRPVSNRKSGR